MDTGRSGKLKLPARIGIVLSILGVLSGVVVVAPLVGGHGFLSAAGDPLVRSLGWAALCLPVFLIASAVVLFLPGYRKDLLILLTGAPLPFLILVFLARFLAEPEAWYGAYPLLEALGLPGTAALGVLAFFLALSLLIKVKNLLAEAREASPPLRPMSLLGAPADGGARRADPPARPSTSARPAFIPLVPEPGEALFPQRAADLPPPEDLAASGSRDAREVPVPDAREGAPASACDAPPPAAERPGQPSLAVCPDDCPPLEAEVAEAEEGAVQDASEAEEADDQSAEPEDDPDSPEEDEPIPVIFGRAPSSARRSSLLSGVTTDPLSEAEMRPTRGAAQASPAPAARPKEPTFESVPPAPRPAPARKPLVAYSLPTEILTVYPDGQYWIIDDKTRHSAEVLRDTLAEFNIEAEVTGIRRGPVVTMFEILPAPGVKLSKIVNLSDNIALRLAASSVRIVAPIPGKHAVGIEVPNDKRSVVSFRELVETDSFRASKPEIAVALGKDIAGEVQIIDLTQMPHLLIAGATGSGKSVCVNSIILSILYRKSWNEVKLLLIDPKIVELKLYNGVPHLLTQVVTEPKRAFQALQYCICEMERRYSLLDSVGVRDIKSYNKRVKERNFAAERLPYIVVVIDEFADLMATTGKELESTLARLAAMSRAVGIHLVLATQRPSIDVITGLIKANIPSRIAFMVASKFDSRIIIDAVGAEKLLGKGDMLVSTAQDAFPVRMQGAFVSEEEVERVVAHVKTLGEPDYIDDEIFYDDEEDDGNLSLFEEDEDDPLFEKALEIVLQQGKASASYLQRRLKIGYNRAARLVELMEEKGIVGPPQGSKPREVMRNPDVAGNPLAARPPRASNPALAFDDEDEDPEDAASGNAEDEEPEA